MGTIRLLYPDYVSGGSIETYYFGTDLLAHILPANTGQPEYRVDVAIPDGRERSVTDGIYAKEDVLSGIRSAQQILEEAKPDRVITLGGTCIVSQAPFDYLHGLYRNLGVVWLDAHPDVSVPADGYPNAHAMVLGALLGSGDPSLSSLVKNGSFPADDVLYIGLQGLHDYQTEFLEEAGVPYRIQTVSFVSDTEILAFLDRFEHVAVHLDIDVLNPAFFHSTYFANPELTGDGSSGGRMTLEELNNVLQLISAHADIVGMTIAEYLPFDEYRLHQILSRLPLLTES